MDSQQTFSHLLERLEYKSSPNLFSSDTSPEKLPEDIKILWHEVQEKLHVDAVYFLANIPIIYFKQFEAFDRQEIAKFHQKVWNQSLVPLIFVILPNYDIRVYNGYKVPRRATNTHELDEPSRLDYELGSSRKEPSTQLWESQDQESSTQLWERLATFTHTAIESGSFWRDYGDHFDRETRADQKLIANLRYIRGTTPLTGERAQATL